MCPGCVLNLEQGRRWRSSIFSAGIGEVAHVQNCTHDKKKDDRFYGVGYAGSWMDERLEFKETVV